MSAPSAVLADPSSASSSTVIRAFEEETPVPLFTGHQTVYELLHFGAERFAKLPCLGTRVKSSNGDPSQYQWITYAEVFEMARHLASGLVRLGLQPGSLIGIYAQNSTEWIVSLIAAQYISLVIVPLYDVAGPKSIQTLVSITKTSVVIASRNNIANLAEAALSCHSIKNVILMDASGVDTTSLTRQGVNVQSFSSILAEGQERPVTVSAPHLDSLYMVMFTSGDPKGVPITHRQISTAVGSMGKIFALKQDDLHVSYLPLVHIMEHIVMLYVLHSGASVGFWSGHIQTLWDDLKVLRPTILLGVPSVFNRMYDGIHANLIKSNPLRRLLFSYAYSSKKKLVETHSDTSFWDRIVFSKIADGIGGRVRLFVSAAAPLMPKIGLFLQMCFCAPLIQVYGLTETTGPVCCTRLELTAAHPKAIGTVGYPLDCNEIKIIPEPDCGSSSAFKSGNDSNSSIAAPSDPNMGEICVRGANVFKGYYSGDATHHQVQSTPQLDEEGWFHTGDIGLWNAGQRTLSIMGTRKNLFKLAQGEYIATEVLQSLYCGSVYVAQIAVVGRTTENYIVAIVVPSRGSVTRWASQNRIDYEENDFSDLCRHPAIKRLIFEDLVKCANAQQLRGFQIVRNIHLEPNAWSTENGFLLPTAKLNRPKIHRAYKDAIDFLYSQPKMDADHPSVPSARL